MKKNNLKIAIFYILLIVVIIIAASALAQSVPSEELTYSDVVQLFKNEQVKQFIIEDDNVLTMIVRVVQKDGTEAEGVLSYELRDINLFLMDLNELVQDQFARGVIERPSFSRVLSSSWP